MLVFDIVGLNTSTFDFTMGNCVCYTYVYMLNAETEKKQKNRTPDSHSRLLYIIYIHTNAAVFHPHIFGLPVSSCCASPELERRFWQSRSSWLERVSLMHSFFRSWLNMCSRSRTHQENGTRAQLPVCPRRRMSQPDPGQARTTSAAWDLAFSRPVTGDYPGVVGKCCPDGSRMLFYQRNT